MEHRLAAIDDVRVPCHTPSCALASDGLCCYSNRSGSDMRHEKRVPSRWQSATGMHESTLQLSSFLSIRNASTPFCASVSAAQAPPGPPPMTATRRGRSRVAPSRMACTCHDAGSSRYDALRARSGIACITNKQCKRSTQRVTRLQDASSPALAGLPRGDGDTLAAKAAAWLAVRQLQRKHDRPPRSLSR